MNRKRILGAVAAALLCGSCFDLTEEIWIEADGSGRIRLDVGIDGETYEMIASMGGEDPFEIEAKSAELEAQIAANPNFTGGKVEAYEEGGSHHMVWEIEVADITQLTSDDLRKLTEDGEGGGSDDDLGGEFSITKTAGGFRFHQEMEDMNADTGEADAMAQAMVSQMFGGHYFTIRVHGPGFESHNGTSAADDYVEWRFALDELMTGDVELLDLEAVITAASGGGSGSGSGGGGDKGRSSSLLYIIIGASVLLVVGGGMILFGRSQA